MNIVIFSKDRASQLELLIRSMKYYFKEFEENTIKILYTYSDNNFKSGYDKLCSIHNEDNIKYIKETNFKKDLLELVDENEEYTIFFVDDNVFKNSLSIKSDKFEMFYNDETILSLSLRLHPELTYCYPARIGMKPPKFDENYIFLWRDQSGDYGYPMSLDGHLFRTKDIYLLLKSLQYNNPNSLESNLARFPINKPRMICFEESIVVNVPINKVQNFNNNIHGNVTASHINDLFLNGKRIQFDNYKGFKNISCHQEVEPKFENI